MVQRIVSRPSTEDAKAQVVAAISKGAKVQEACDLVGRSLDTYERWRRTDPDFKARIDKTRDQLAGGKAGTQRPVPDFPEFCEKYLHMRLWLHQLQWFDLLEGREPRGLHPAATYEPGKPSRLLINIPPGHSKSTTLTVAYSIWRLIKNPNIKIAIISKKQGMADQFLLQIKERLTDPLYQDLINDFAPVEGFDSNSASWSAHQIYLSSDVRDAVAKDPTVQALGIGGALYGTRLDLVILDDCVDNLNAAEYEKQARWVLGVVSSRLAPRTGRCLVIGTRMAQADMYSQLVNPDIYPRGTHPWTYLRQPAVLEYAEDPKDWVTLWPETEQPEDPDDEPLPNGNYVRFNGEVLSDIRDTTTSDEWARMYQQEQISTTGAFPADLVNSARGMHNSGVALPDNPITGRDGGMRGLRILAGLDPAVTGFTAMVCLGVDQRQGDIWVLDVFNKANLAPAQMRGQIRTWTERYGVQEWIIEKNAFQGFLTNDEQLKEYLNHSGAVLRPHFTSSATKYDPDHGVASMSLTFERGKIHLPNFNAEAVRQFADQLMSWEPGVRQNKKGKKWDIVMAFWFAHLRANELIRTQRGSRFVQSQFHTRADRWMQRVVTRDELLGEAAMAGAV